MIEYGENLLLNSPEAFDSLWQRAFGLMDMPPVRPQVDFSTHQVLALFLGGRNKGGFTLVIERIYQHNGRLIVQYLEKVPGKSCISAAVIDFPFFLVKIPASDYQTCTFQGRKEIFECK